MANVKFTVGQRVQVCRRSPRDKRFRRRVGEPASGRVVDVKDSDMLGHTTRVMMDWSRINCCLWFTDDELRPERWHDFRKAVAVAAAVLAIMAILLWRAAR